MKKKLEAPPPHRSLLPLHGQPQTSVHHQHLSGDVGRLQQEEGGPGDFLRLAEPPQRHRARRHRLRQPGGHVGADEAWRGERGRGYSYVEYKGRRRWRCDGGVVEVWRTWSQQVDSDVP